MFDKNFRKFMKCCCLVIYIQILSLAGHFQDQTSPRTNTLLDDADDIQRQLDNESKDRLKYGRPKTVWVLQFRYINPTAPMNLENITARTSWHPRRHTRSMDDDQLTTPTTAISNPKDWDFDSQDKWSKEYPGCGGRSQSPVDLPYAGHSMASGARSILFQNYAVMPKSISAASDGKRLIVSGNWANGKRPLIYGGAAHSRRYLFHSLTYRSPSEHRVGGLNYPLESQAYFISAEYKNWDEAMESSLSDPQAFLGVVSLYKFGNKTHHGTAELLDAVTNIGLHNRSIPVKPLMYFTPPFKEYICYQGSLTVPPCTESVLWLVRARALSISRCTMAAVQSMVMKINSFSHLTIREPQALNDRKVYHFK